MFTHSTEPYPITGTTRPIPISRNAEPKIIRAGHDYFFVQIYAAQAAFTGSIWEQVKGLVITSQVSVGNDSYRAIQRSRSVRRERAEQLGLAPNLIHLVPASMSQISISVEFVLDKDNRLAQLAGLINDDSFLAVVSLAPGAVMVAKMVSGIAQKIIATFVPPQERQPILQFSGDFNIAAGGLQDGYYVILGTRDERNPLPNPLPKFEVRDGELLANGVRVTQLSYVILDVRRTEARSRALNENAKWEVKLREAESVAQLVGEDPFTDENTKRNAWDKCKRILEEARILLFADPNYLPREAELIFKTSFKYCVDQVSRTSAIRGTKSDSIWKPNEMLDRSELGITQTEDLARTVQEYAGDVTTAQRILRQAKFL